MTELILAEDLARMGAIKSDINHLILDDVLYSRDTSFSLRVQAAAEQMYQDYQQQNIKCLLVKDRHIITLWRSQPCTASKNELQTLPSPPSLVPPQTTNQGDSEAPEDEKIVEKNSVSQTHFQSDTREKIMTYRGNIYKVITNENTLLEAPSESKPEDLKKRIYRGVIY
ncbi:hypothetical protein [Calothrix sp. UHCC 0171]|uniref:hypothetical protein n=1 Tax=Calothrix sp. UHCC 0171 TaxID=3110245 RepID=UPI002B1FE0D0|nr:hypothetical protein [Calothrix sp. UHCC 0171]MEA5570070.1 hypothetical protein [Calothrix sp. UHCC 0171]